MSWTVQGLVGQLRTTDETERVEAKRSLGEATMRSISSFSNEPGLRGGWVVFGVQRDQDTGRYELVGVQNPDRLQTELVTQCRSRFNRQVVPEVRVDLCDGQPVVVAFIPEAPAADKPVYLKKLGLPKGAFRRIGSVDQEATDADLRRFASLAERVPFDRRPAAGARPNDLDPEAVAAFRRELQARRPASDLLDLSDQELLIALSALDDSKGELVPTHAGLLLFGTAAALRRLMPSTRLDILQMTSPEAIDAYQVIEIREALVTGWRKAIRAVSAALPRRVSLAADAVQRTEAPRIPEVVLREAIINALMHRDLEVASPVQVRSYPDSIVIENPGHSLLRPEDWGQLRSEARNPTLASVLHEIDLAETRGTGILRMRKRMQAMGLPEPVLVSERGANRFRVTLSFHHLLDEADWAWLARFEGLDDADRQVLWLGLRPGGVRNEDVREVCGDDTLAASHRLVRLRDRGYLVRRGEAKQHAWYEVAREHRPTGVQPQARQPEDLGAQPEDLDGQPEDLGVQPEDLRVQPEDLGVQPEDLSPALRARVEGLPGKARRDVVEALLLELCRLGWWDPGHLARLLKRNRGYLITTFLTPLVERGALVLRYPDRKHHPRQAYTTSSENAGGTHEV